MTGVGRDNFVNECSAYSLSLTIHSYCNSVQKYIWDSLISKPRVFLIVNSKNSVTYNRSCVSLFSYNNLVVTRVPIFFHDEFIELNLKCFLVHQHKLWENLWFVFLGFLNEFDNDIVVLGASCVLHNVF